MKKDNWDVKGRYKKGIREQRGWWDLRTLFLVALVAMAGAGCWLDRSVTGPTQNTTVIVNQGGQPTPSPSASPSPGAEGADVVDGFRVGVFGYAPAVSGGSCAAPSNSSGLLPTDCQVAVTGSPKKGSVDAKGPGTNITWSVSGDVDRFNVTAPEDNPLFNRDVVLKRDGTGKPLFTSGSITLTAVYVSPQGQPFSGSTTLAVVE